jgi:hypothetical protein
MARTNHSIYFFVLTLKYGEQAERITLCALRNCPSALSVTSTSDSSSSNVSNTERMVERWLFHLRQNCCSLPPMMGLMNECGGSGGGNNGVGNVVVVVGKSRDNRRRRRLMLVASASAAAAVGVGGSEKRDKRRTPFSGGG